mmetsp:Transcript_32747/g.89664  ORF Transcript_32747/g.89664 Transcript_32747/m.89664 type:complete len:268 (-) Transcript_32747:402-1205(-)
MAEDRVLWGEVEGGYRGGSGERGRLAARRWQGPGCKVVHHSFHGSARMLRAGSVDKHAFRLDLVLMVEAETVHVLLKLSPLLDQQVRRPGLPRVDVRKILHRGGDLPLVVLVLRQRNPLVHAHGGSAALGVGAVSGGSSFQELAHVERALAQMQARLAGDVLRIDIGDEGLAILVLQSEQEPEHPRGWVVLLLHIMDVVQQCVALCISRAEHVKIDVLRAAGGVADAQNATDRCSVVLLDLADDGPTLQGLALMQLGGQAHVVVTSA